jgi:hypothetical protein
MIIPTEIGELQFEFALKETLDAQNLDGLDADDGFHDGLLRSSDGDACMAGYSTSSSTFVRRRRVSGAGPASSSPPILCVPAAFEHGFVALTDEATLHYCISVEYEPSAAAGLLSNDPDIGIAWPLTPRIISDHDRSLMSLKEFRERLSA